MNEIRTNINKSRQQKLIHSEEKLSREEEKKNHKMELGFPS